MSEHEGGSRRRTSSRSRVKLSHAEAAQRVGRSTADMGSWFTMQGRIKSNLGAMIEIGGGSNGKLPSWAIDVSEIEWLEKLAEGTFGEVYRARWRGTDVAVKRQKDRHHGKLFLREVALLSELRHPNIVQFLGAVVEHKSVLLVSEFLGTGDVRALIKKRDPVLCGHPALAVQIMVDVANALAFLHGNKPAPVVHRDIKSPNVLLTASYRAKLADVGLALQMQHDASPVRQVGGTLRWSAPETHFIETANYTPAADVYSFGMLCYELVAFDIPFSRLPDAKVLVEVDLGRRPKLPERVDPRLAALIKRCWDGEPRRRPTMAEVVAELTELQRLYGLDKEAINHARALAQSPLMSQVAETVGDPARLRALQRTGLLDAKEPNAALDRVTRLTSRATGAPVALVSLVDFNRQHFTAQTGLPAPYDETRETPLSHSFCQHVVHQRSPLIIDDANEHAVLQSNLAVSDIGVIAYCGVPIMSPDGMALGSMCAIDVKPHKWTEEDIETLQDMAQMVEEEIARRPSARLPVNLVEVDGVPANGDSSPHSHVLLAGSQPVNTGTWRDPEVAARSELVRELTHELHNIASKLESALRPAASSLRSMMCATSGDLPSASGSLNDDGPEFELDSDSDSDTTFESDMMDAALAYRGGSGGASAATHKVRHAQPPPSAVDSFDLSKSCSDLAALLANDSELRAAWDEAGASDTDSNIDLIDQSDTSDLLVNTGGLSFLQSLQLDSPHGDHSLDEVVPTALARISEIRACLDAMNAAEAVTSSVQVPMSGGCDAMDVVRAVEESWPQDGPPLITRVPPMLCPLAANPLVLRDLLNMMLSHCTDKASAGSGDELVVRVMTAGDRSSRKHNVTEARPVSRIVVGVLSTAAVPSGNKGADTAGSGSGSGSGSTESGRSGIAGGRGLRRGLSTDSLAGSVSSLCCGGRSGIERADTDLRLSLARVLASRIGASLWSDPLGNVLSVEF